MNTIGVMAGSFDPITNGHIWLARKALSVVDKLIIVVANNSQKKHTFSIDKRLNHLSTVFSDEIKEGRVNVDLLGFEMLAAFAARHDANFMFRGLRNATDLVYETDIAKINRRIAPSVETLFLMPPAEMVEISSSMVRGLVGLRGWEPLVEQFVPTVVMSSFKSMV